MTLINGQLRDSGGLPLSGTLTITLDAPIVVGDDVYTTKPITLTVPSTGIFSTTLLETETHQVTYRFTLFATGADPENDAPILDFHAVVPNDEIIDFGDLVPIPLSSDVLPSGLRRIVQLILGDPDNAKYLRWGTPRGVYNASTFYTSGDIVTFEGSSYVFTSDNLLKGLTPATNPDVWQPLGLRGEPGTGTTGIDSDFDPEVWSLSNEAPSRSSLANVIIDRRNPTIPYVNVPSLSGFDDTAVLSKKAIDDHFVKRDSPTLEGDPKAPTKGVGDGTNSIATCAHVKATFTEVVNNYVYTPPTGQVIHLAFTVGTFLSNGLYQDENRFLWYPPSGNTIGQASSNATVKDDRLIKFYRIMWANVGSSGAIGWNVLGSSGSVVSKGVDADADFYTGRVIQIPNLLGRSIVAAGTGSGLTARNVLSTGGAETVALTTNEMPSHNHTASTNTTGSHNHQFAHRNDAIKILTTATGATGYTFYLTDGSAANNANTVNAGDHSHTVTVNNNGSGSAHQNMHPWKAYTELWFTGIRN